MHAFISVYLTSMVIVVAVAAYLLPTLVAWLRHAPDTASVAVINIALGWTFVGWIAALAMALRKAQPPVVQVFSQVNAPAGPTTGERLLGFAPLGPAPRP
jgi:hypothetical protein